jgi:hypothetical protein
MIRRRHPTCPKLGAPITTHSLFIVAILVAAILLCGGCAKKAVSAPGVAAGSVATKARETTAPAVERPKTLEAAAVTAPTAVPAEAAEPEDAGPAASKRLIEPASDKVATSPAHVSAAPTCAYDGVDFPAQTAQLHADLVAVAKTIGRASVAIPAGKTSWAFKHHGFAYAVISAPKGYWLLSKLGGRPVSADCKRV